MPGYMLVRSQALDYKSLCLVSLQTHALQHRYTPSNSDTVFLVAIQLVVRWSADLHSNTTHARLAGQHLPTQSEAMIQSGTFSLVLCQRKNTNGLI